MRGSFDGHGVGFVVGHGVGFVVGAGVGSDVGQKHEAISIAVGQDMHDVCPSLSWYVPIGHEMLPIEPLSSW